MDSGVRTLWLAKLGSRSLRQYKTCLLGCCPRARDDLTILVRVALQPK
jgi:hypothetical protein